MGHRHPQTSSQGRPTRTTRVLRLVLLSGALSLPFSACARTGGPESWQARFTRQLAAPPYPGVCHLATLGVLGPRIVARCQPTTARAQ